MALPRTAPPARSAGWSCPAATSCASSWPTAPPILVRPSGTEPKIKVYILTKGVDAAERDANIEKYSAWVKTLTE